MTPQPNDKSNTIKPMTMKYLSFKQFFTESEIQKPTAISVVESKESKW